jgi:hypothetical protein
MRKFHLMTAAIMLAASPAAAQTFQVAQAPEAGQCAVVAQEPGPIIGQAIDALLVIDNGNGNGSARGDGDGYTTHAEAETALQTIDVCKS